VAEFRYVADESLQHFRCVVETVAVLEAEQAAATKLRE
jgi:hypothetical protein